MRRPIHPTAPFLPLFMSLLICLLLPCTVPAQQGAGPPKTPVRVAAVDQNLVAEQITLIGTTEAIAESTVASEVSGIVDFFPVKEGEFPLVRQLDLGASHASF